MPSLRFLRLCAATLAIGAVTSLPAHASSYPDRQARLLVGFTPGGPVDLTARLVARHLTDNLGQQVIVENKAGAGGNIATREMVRTTPDGYSHLVSGVNLTINPWMTDDMPVEAVRSLRPVRIVTTMPTVLVVRNDFPARDLQGFVAAVRKAPGKYDASAQGASPLLAVELFGRQTSTRIVPVPYKGAAPAMVDLMAGHVDLSFASLGSVLPHIRSGKVRAIALAAEARDPQMPDVPTFAEQGMPDFRFDAWVGVLAPPDTPDAVIEVLTRSLDKLVEDEDFARQVVELGMTPVREGSPAVFAQVIDEELALYESLASTVRAAMPQ